MICKKCGTDVDASFGVCYKCGTVLEEPKTASQPNPQAAPQPKPQAAPQPRPQAAPQPKPQVAPQPKPQVAPQPNPQAAPQPKPQSAPQPKPPVQPVAPNAAADNDGVEATSLFDNSFDSEQYVNSMGSQPPKKKKKKVWLIVLLSVIGVLIAAAAVIFFCFRDWAEGLVVGMSSPEDHQMYVYKNFAEDFTEKYGELLSAYEKTDIGTEGKVSIELSDTAKDLISESGVDVSGIDSVELAYDMNSANNVVSMDAALFFNKSELIDAELVVDMNSGIMTIAIPDLSDKALEIDLKEYGMMDAAAMSTTELLPGADLVKELLPRYIDVAFAAITGVERSSEDFTINGVSQGAKCFTTVITDKVARDVAVAVLREAKQDPELKGYIISTLNKTNEMYELDEDPNEAYTDFIEGIDSVLEDLSQQEITGEVLMNVKTWADSSNDIIGIRLFNDSGDMLIGAAQDGDYYEFELSYAEDGEKLMLISVSGTENDDIFNGYAYVEAEGEEVVDIEIENLTTVDDKFVGKLTITSEALNDINTGLGMANLTIVGRVENGYEELIIGVGSGEAQLISLTIGGTEHAPKVAQPHSNTVSDPDDWSAEFDTDKLQEAFEDSGLLEVIQSIAQVYYENMYGDFYDDYYDYYYDDYDDSYFEDDGDIYAYSDEYDNGYLAGYADGLADGADGDYLNSYDFSADENGDAYYEGYDAGYEEGFDEAFDQ